MYQLSEKETQLLSVLAKSEGSPSQRKLADHAGFSIGLLNTSLRKLIRRGYVKARAMNKKRIHYFLTPKGISEIVKRSYVSVLYTIKNYHDIENGIVNLMQGLVNNGYKKIIPVGDSELLNLLYRVHESRFKGLIEISTLSDSAQEDAILLNLTDNQESLDGIETIHFFEYLKLFAQTQQNSSGSAEAVR